MYAIRQTQIEGNATKLMFSHDWSELCILGTITSGMMSLSVRRIKGSRRLTFLITVNDTLVTGLHGVCWVSYL